MKKEYILDLCNTPQNAGTGYRSVRYLVAQKFGFNYLSAVKGTSEDGFTKLWMDIKLNPRWMFHEDSHPFTYVASPEEALRGYEYIQEFLDSAKITEIEYRMFVIHRIDYCVNIDMENRELVKTYMRLIRKGCYPYKMKRKMEYSESGHRQVLTKDSFTVFSKTVEFAIYLNVHSWKKMKNITKKIFGRRKG